MNSTHTPKAEGPLASGSCQHQKCFVPRGLRCGRDRSKHSLKRHRPCFACSTKPPDTCVDLPEPTPSLPSCEIRNQLEQLYQLEHPQHRAWYTSSLFQEVAARGVSLEQAGFLPVQPCAPPPEASKLKDPDSKQHREDYYANVGDAIRTLRDETPYLFQQDLSYDVYRDDIVFTDSRNVFHGKKNYRTIFWSLRFHGRLFFSRLTVNVLRIWQPNENAIRLRWTVRGVPRVPWEAEGIFDGISEYKLDREGKIYEHKITNVQMRDPPLARSLTSIGLNMIPIPRLQGAPQAPCPGAFCQGLDEEEMGRGLSAYIMRFSWIRLYAALLGTVQLLRGRKQASTVLGM
ncbi:hypothetical protein WJX77_006773 [Trebouxia sp. C0004]